MILPKVRYAPGALVTIASIKAATAAHYRLPRRVMVDRMRAVQHARPRQVAMFLARRMTRHSRAYIGAHFGGRDPTTVYAAEKRIGALIFADRATRRGVWKIAKAVRP